MAFPHFGRAAAVLPTVDGSPSRLRCVWAAGLASGSTALRPAWPFVLTGLLYLGYLAFTANGVAAVSPPDVPRAWQMQLYYLACAKSIRPGQAHACQKLGVQSILLLRPLSVLQPFAVYKPTELRG